MADITFREELETLINRYSKENGSDTPDFILADYLCACLGAFDAHVRARDEWNGLRQKQILWSSLTHEERTRITGGQNPTTLGTVVTHVGGSMLGGPAQRHGEERA